MASSWMLVLQEQEWLPFWGKVLVRTSSGWRTADEMVQIEWWQKRCGFIEKGWLAWTRICYRPISRSIRENLLRGVIKSWDKIHWNVSYLMHDNWDSYFRTWRRRSLFSGRALTCQKTIQRVKFNKAITRHTKIRDQNPSLGYICPGEPHERSPNAPKFEDRSQEETEWQELGARESSVEAGQKCVQIKRAWKSSILLVSGKIGACLHQRWKPEEREFCCGLRCVNAHDQQKGP